MVELINAVLKYLPWGEITTHTAQDIADCLIENDFVQVVRCCDCKHGTWDDEEALWKCVYSAEFDDDISEWLGFCDYNNGDHFCSYGERKDNERKAD